MRRNRIAIVIVVLMAALSIWFLYKNQKGTIRAEMRDFAVTDTTSINKIFLADKKGRTLTLERDAHGVWMLNGKYKARTDMVKTLLKTISRVEVKEPVTKKMEEGIIKKLSTNAIKCEIYQNNELTKAYYVGSETTDLTGTYMIMIDLETMKAVERPFVTYIPGFQGYLTTRYYADELAWRDRTVFEYNPNDIKSIKVETPQHPGFGYELIVKGNNNYEIRTLENNKVVEGIDPLAVKQYLAYFQKLEFEAFEDNISNTQIDSVKKSTPINILTVTDKNGKSNRVSFYARNATKKKYDDNGKLIQLDEERMDALLNNGVDFVVVQFFIFGKVMPTVDYFQKETARSPQATNIPLNKQKI